MIQMRQTFVTNKFLKSFKKEADRFAGFSLNGEENA